MGANASTAVPVYVSGEVLDAARLNLTNAGVPVFAGTATRDAAFGGTGEKTLAEGQLCYLEDSNVVQYYDSAAWQTVGINPGLVCVKAETAFSAASSITADNVFTSTYRNYKIIINYTTSSTGNVFLKLRVGGVSATTNYNYQNLEVNGTTVTAARSTSQSDANVGVWSNGAFNCTLTLDLFNPQIATGTTYQSNCVASLGAYTTPFLNYNNGNHSTATAYDGIEITTSSGNMTGNYVIFGYGKTL